MKNKLVNHRTVVFLLMIIGIYFGTGIQVANSRVETRSTAKRFFSDDLLFFGQDSTGHDFVLDLSLNRKQKSDTGEYVHYYFATLKTKDGSSKANDTVYEYSEEVQPNKFLKTFKNKISPDNSSRESIELNLELQGINFEITIPELTADFIVKNTLDYTKYLSEGKAVVKLNGSMLNVNCLLTKIYSADYSTSIFFPDADKLHSVTDVLTLWDENNNFYFLDTTTAYQYNPAYTSHTWALSKSQPNNFLKRAFKASFSLVRREELPALLSVNIPDFDNLELNLEVPFYNQEKKQEGVVYGVVNTRSSRKKIRGYFQHYVYQ